MAAAAKASAIERVQRLLAIVPWVVEQGGASVEELCTRFAVTEKELVDDLERFGMTGVYPYTPDALNEMVLDDDWVSISVGPWFRRPLSLTHDQAVAVLAAASALASTPGNDPDGPLARALAKVRRVLGDTDDAGLDVDLGRADAEQLETLRGAVSDGVAVRIEYYSAGRDVRRTRVVEPSALVPRDGAWYLAAWCREAEASRMFRVDRISELEVLDEPVVERAGPENDWFSDPGDLPKVTLHVRPPGRILLEHVPVIALDEADDGSVTVTLAVSGEAWWASLLTRLGLHADVLSIDAPADRRDALVAAPGAMADRILRRYGVSR